MKDVAFVAKLTYLYPSQSTFKMTAICNQKQVNTRVIFRKFDKDSDGFISVKDLISVFKELGEEIRDEELKEQLHNAGKIDRCEIQLQVSFD